MHAPSFSYRWPIVSAGDNVDDDDDEDGLEGEENATGAGDGDQLSVRNGRYGGGAHADDGPCSEEEQCADDF